MLKFYLKVISISLLLSIFISHKTLKAQENNLSYCHQLMETIETEGFDRVTPASEQLLAQALIECSFETNLTAVQQLLDIGVDPDSVQNEEDGISLLMWATFNNKSDLVYILLGEAHPDIQNRDGVTALMIASDKGYTGIVIALLEAGANPLIRHRSGATARSFALRNMMREQHNNEHFNNFREIQSLLRQAEENYQNR